MSMYRNEIQYVLELEDVKDRKRRPEGVEWESQISFETFDRCSKINPQKAYKQKLRKLEPPRVKRP
jgi:hypothetical protein